MAIPSSAWGSRATAARLKLTRLLCSITATVQTMINLGICPGISQKTYLEKIANGREKEMSKLSRIKALDRHLTPVNNTSRAINTNQGNTTHPRGINSSPTSILIRTCQKSKSHSTWVSRRNYRSKGSRTKSSLMCVSISRRTRTVRVSCCRQKKG